MILTAPGRNAALLVGTLVPFLMAFSVWTPSARAGCHPHWLTSRAHSQAELKQLRLLTSGAEGVLDGRKSPRGPAPCSGAFCAGNPASPASTAPSLVQAGGEHGALLADSGASRRPGMLLAHGHGTPPFPEERAEAILHPPRRIAGFDLPTS